VRRRKLTPSQCDELWDRYEGKCWRCKLPIDKHKRDSWHWGHILALSCGGEDKPANMAPECRNCNETDARANVTPLAAKIKRIKRRHIGAEEQSPWSKRLERYRYDWKLRRYVLEDSSNGN
jgi:hypothetical protein